MAVKTEIPYGVLFIGETKKLRIQNVTGDDGLPLNLSGMSFTFVLKLDAEKTTLPLFSKTTALNQVRVGGVFNSSAASNTQYIEVDIDRANTAPLDKGKHYFSVRRDDVGGETVVAYGTIMIDQAA
jgi:hypothetical protein